jgi:hypothetical protein
MFIAWNIDVPDDPYASATRGTSLFIVWNIHEHRLEHRLSKLGKALFIVWLVAHPCNQHP